MPYGYRLIHCLVLISVISLLNLSELMIITPITETSQYIPILYLQQIYPHDMLL